MERRITCREFVDFLADYLSGELPPGQLAAFNDHLARCPSCASYDRTYLQAMQLGKAVLRCDDEPVPADVPEDLIQTILAARKGTS